MPQVIKIDAEELRRIFREEVFKAVAELVNSMREGEAIISAKELEENRKLSQMLQEQDDEYLSGKEVAEILGCTSGQVTKLKLKGVLEPIYPFGSRTPKYSKAKLMKMIQARTIPAYHK